MRGSMTVLVTLLASTAMAQDGGVKGTAEVAKAIRALRSAKPAERIEAAKLLSRQSSEIVPALMPWNWGCGEGTGREGAVAGADCARINEAAYHVFGVLAAIARKEPATCEPSCPARQALFGITTEQGGIDWDRLPLEDDDEHLPAAVRGEALGAYAKAQFRESFPLPDWRAPTASPSARVGGTSVFFAKSTTQSMFNMACAIALYAENERGRVGKLVARDAQVLGLGCELGKVEAAAVSESPGVLAVAVDWVPLGDGGDRAQTLLVLRPEKGQLKPLCSVVGASELVARRSKLLRVGPKGCTDLKGKPVGLGQEISTLSQ